MKKKKLMPKALLHSYLEPRTSNLAGLFSTRSSSSSWSPPSPSSTPSPRCSSEADRLAGPRRHPSEHRRVRRLEGAAAARAVAVSARGPANEVADHRPLHHGHAGQRDHVFVDAGPG